MRRVVVGTALVVFALLPRLAWSQTITFDNVAVGTQPGASTYSQMGVVFQTAARVVSLPGQAHSGSNVLVSNDLSAEFDPAPLTIRFMVDVKSVKLYTGAPWNSPGRQVRISLGAYNSAGAKIAESTKDITGPTPISILMEVQAPQGQFLREVRLDVGQYFEYIDDLSFVSRGAAPAPITQQPTVAITQPAQNSSLSAARIIIAGTIDGPGLTLDVTPPKLTIAYSPDATTHEPSQYNTYLFPPQLAGSGTHFGFSLPIDLWHYGKNTVTVQATNSAGTGQAQTIVTFLPQNIVDEYNRHGGATMFGEFVWGSPQGVRGNCSIAVYQRGGIFGLGAATYAITGNIWVKWNSLRSSGDTLGLLGCPTGDATPIVGGTVQRFAHGHIYSSGRGTYYVLPPFSDALDNLKLVGVLGLPATDTVRQSTFLLPRLWQRFERVQGSMTLVSAMEVSDQPPTLWIATPDVSGAQRVGAAITPRLPTVWQSFSCNSVDGPCQYSVTPPEIKVSAQNVDGLMSTGCDGSSYPWDPNEWVSLAQNIIVPYWGTVKTSGLSGEDAPFTHSCSADWSADGVDWCMHVSPDPGYERLLGSGQSDLEVEYEYCLIGYPVPVDTNDPGKGVVENLQSGDKVYVAGRWIVDCGHSYRTEIHPPAVLVHTFTTPDSSTVGELLSFPWWYPNQSVEVDLYPPPRPTADAVMSAVIPASSVQTAEVDPQAGVENREVPYSAPNHIHVKLTGRRDVSTPPAEDEGKVIYGCPPAPASGRPLPCDTKNRAILGRYTVGWTTP